MVKVIKRNGRIETLDVAKIQKYTSAVINDLDVKNANSKRIGYHILNANIVFSYRVKDKNVDIRISRKGFICVTSTEENGNLILYKLHYLKDILWSLLREVSRAFKYERMATFIKEYFL